MKKNLILFTNGFPCVKVGEEFLEVELKLLSKEFESVVIYVLERAEICREIPANTEVKFLEKNPSLKVRNTLLKYGTSFFKIYRDDLKDPVTKKAIRNNKGFYRNVLLGNFLLMQSLKKELEQVDLNQTKLYSYWCGPWFDILMLLDKEITDKIVFRAHGYDFDVNQRPEKYIPYRNHLIKKNPFISFISQFGFSEYSLKYPTYKNKSIHRLGVEEQTLLNSISKQKEISIVSCSSLIPLKRVNLIIDILKQSSHKIKWVHFGDGPLMNEIKQKAKKELPVNIIAEFKGYVSHDEIVKYYKENPVDLVMNVSELEGIPVSLMEAISFGIPVTGCNVCGVPEIVTKETGFLWEVNFEPKKALHELEEYFNSSVQEKEKLRNSAWSHWCKHFNANKNYTTFIKGYLLN